STHSEEWLGKVIKDVVECGYEFSSFLFTVSAPPTLVLRDASMMCHLSKLVYPGQDVYRESAMSTFYNALKREHHSKKTVKFQLGPRTREATGATFDAEGEMKVVMRVHTGETLVFPPSIVATFSRDLRNLLAGKTGRRRHNQEGDAPRRHSACQADHSHLSNAVQRFVNGHFTEPDHIRTVMPCPPPCRIHPFTPEAEGAGEPFSVTHSLKYDVEPIMVLGRYRKEEREVSQTTWAFAPDMMSIQKGTTSVLQPLFDCKSALFHAAGREDIDVRMLGSGRPFCLELLQPK
ncbi:hypothetical protein KIPB_012944, partial [Kipferlia bialata]